MDDPTQAESDRKQQHALQVHSGRKDLSDTDHSRVGAIDMFFCRSRGIMRGIHS
jgi:hypothetical protein